MSADAGQGDQGSTAARREQNLRRRAREAEEARDRLAKQVENYRRREVETVAAAHLADSSDVWSLGGVELDALLDNDGAVDATKVESVAQTVIESRGERFARPRPRADHDGGARATSTPPRTSWSSVLSGEGQGRR